MATTITPMFDQTLALARRLSPHDRARLIAVLAQELVEPSTTPQASDAWDRWAALREEIARTHPQARLGDRLDADRRARDVAVAGQPDEIDVHP